MVQVISKRRKDCRYKTYSENVFEMQRTQTLGKIQHTEGGYITVTVNPISAC